MDKLIVVIGINVEKQALFTPEERFEQVCHATARFNNAAVAELFVPLGLRYHALHHLFPHLPYHVLGKAHRRLMRALPADSDYHRTVRPGIAAVFHQLWKNSWAPKAEQHAEAKAAA